MINAYDCDVHDHDVHEHDLCDRDFYDDDDVRDHALCVYDHLLHGRVHGGHDDHAYDRDHGHGCVRDPSYLSF